MRILLAILVLLVALPARTAPAEGPWKSAAPGYVWSFPADLASHPEYKTEWWYITGHLQPEDDASAEPLGFQLTFFRIGLSPAVAVGDSSAWSPTDLVMAHAAVGDPASRRHVFSEVIRRATPFLGGFGSPGDTVLAWCRAPSGTDAAWSLQHRDGSYILSVRDDRQGLHYELTCTPTRPRVFHGEGGFSPKTPEGDSGSLYFSRTRMATRGTVLRDGARVPVTGTAWLDREVFTSTLGGDQVGWDWTALNFDDGTDLMLYRLRDKEGRENFALGTRVHPDNSLESMTTDRWSLEPLEHWESPKTGSRYPVKWKLEVAGRANPLILQAAFPEQENVSDLTGIHYWEGAVTIHDGNGGAPIGRGFVELTGYGEGSRPPV